MRHKVRCHKVAVDFLGDLEHSMHRDANDPERQEQQPDEGVGYERQQSQRPAKYKKDAP